MKAKYQSVLDLGQKLEIQEGDVKEENGVLHISGVAKNQYEKNLIWDEIKKAGGEGLIYWEPAWVSTSCSTLWGQGSHWDNATLFDENNMPTLGMNFYNDSKNE